MKLPGKIESLLFVASKPLTIRKIAELVGADEADVRQAIESLRQLYNIEDRGIQLAQHANSVQLVTNPLSAKIVADFLKDERSGELTRPSLETLTIIAYRGPLPKSEIDLIRGVNCALILRNLMVRGLITAREDRQRMTTLYELSFDFLRHLGIREVRELPDYGRLTADQNLDRLLHPKPPPAEPVATLGNDQADAEEQRDEA
ncbi:MAG: SMC-Scp complex subunit ScpB [Candidatus Kerfeldbacteria bacterium]|nr:SMC-Scp complex subunit ScpB [Candidatus Kerfeldbacteria bacterium]